jgi:hypothetical protein
MSTPKLNQVVAVVQGKKSRLEKDKTEIYKKLQKAALFDGLTRVYKPSDEEGETFPPEHKNIQYSVKEANDEFFQVLIDLMDATATMDEGNCAARADLKVDGETVLPKVPVTHLLFLEKQLTDLQTFLGHAPVLDPAESWKWDEATACYRSNPSSSNRTKKVMRNHVKYEATEKHPAQVETYTEDVKVGEWSTVKFSGAVPQQTKNAWLTRVRQLIEAVKCAREEANALEVKSVKFGQKLIDFILRPV